ncbi:hypothetical protein CDAR_483111 [Caerostris darwini]|uniref:Uncharacterized protein n=1 Tax=Caerostris darwini TaxID=1538125 RepID=A0AAV4V4H9_9ARAC|nr:hypothetical protein CDAR_483111 [Caerostris darwini]
MAYPTSKLEKKKKNSTHEQRVVACQFPDKIIAAEPPIRVTFLVSKAAMVKSSRERQQSACFFAKPEATPRDVTGLQWISSLQELAAQTGNKKERKKRSKGVIKGKQSQQRNRENASNADCFSFISCCNSSFYFFSLSRFW